MKKNNSNGEISGLEQEEMQETKLSGKSLDIITENISKLKELFPEIVTEDKIDFDKFKEVFGNYVEDSLERYNFTWKGKSAALRLAQTPSTGTLRPCKEESKNWDTTENLYIEGDNLEVLKLLQKSYYGKIKMIYIDPPYNTGKEFVYKDNYKDNLQNYLEITGQVDSEGTKISTNTDKSGRYHTNWLNMMYPRLRLARNLLSDDGVIFISIDDNEVHNLRKICDEIFGEENFITQLNWKGRGGRQDSKYYAVIHEYILVYAKNISNFIAGEEIKEGDVYPKYDSEKGRKYKTQLARKWGSNSRRTDRPNLFYPIIAPDGSEVYPMLSETEEGCWRWGKTRMQNEIDSGNVEFVKKDDLWIVYEKIYEPLAGEEATKKYNTWIDDIGSGTGSGIIKNLFNSKVFDYPKPVELINRILLMANVDKDSIVLDFFSGSATTAHGVLQYNSKNNFNLKYIMVQLPELIDEEDEAFQGGYLNICEIGKERIRRAGDKIVSEMNQNGQTSLDSKQNTDLDIGFKVFKLDSSNLAKWDPEYDNLEQTLLDSVDNLVPGRSELDLIYEIMLKYGVDLTLPIEEYQVNEDKTTYSIGHGALLICLNDNIKADFASEILKLKEELSPEITRVVFKDNGFASDSDKTNIKETLKTHGIDEFVTI